MDTLEEQGAEVAQAGELTAPQMPDMSGTDTNIATVTATTPSLSESTTSTTSSISAGIGDISTDADVGNVVASPVVEPSASDTSSSVQPASPAPVTAATVAQEHPAHSAITRLERLIERVSSDFLKEGQTLIAAARAEIDKLI